MASVDYKQLDKVNTAINITSFCFTLPLAVVLFWKYGFKLDKSAIFILSTYLFANFSREFTSSSNYSIIDMINPICSTLIWGVLLHVVLEMRHIHSLLTSGSHLEYKSKVNAIRWTRIILMGNLALIYCPINLAIFVFKGDFQNEYYEILTVVVIIRAISLTIFQGYLFPAFIKHFYFFVKKKAEFQYT